MVRYISALLIFMSCNAIAGVGLNVYGLSYHPDREQVARQHLNEVNPGLALRYEWRNDVFAEAGGFRDSYGGRATFADIGYQWRLGHWRLGGALAVAQASIYNEGKAFIAPLPIVSFDVGAASINGTYFPRTAGNGLAAFALYLTLRF